MSTSIVNGNFHFADTLTAGNLVPSSGTVNDGKVADDADIDPDKLGKEHERTIDGWTFLPAQAWNVTKVYRATGSVKAFRAWCVTVPGAASTVTIDLKKNGTTILSGTIVLDNTNTNYLAEDAAGFASTALVAGDVLTVTFTFAGANAPVGAAAQVIWQESAT